MTTGDGIPQPSGDTDELALDFLEQWLSGSQTHPPLPTPDVQRSLDPGLRAIERLVAQHKDLFRRHAENR